MCKNIKVFKSLNDQDNQAINGNLSKLGQQKEVVVEYRSTSKILSEFMELPSILTDDGDRLYGVDAINNFTQVQLTQHSLQTKNVER